MGNVGISTIRRYAAYVTRRVNGRPKMNSQSLFESSPEENSESQDDQQQVLSVSEVNHLVKQLVNEAFPTMWVSGEISDIARPRSGHLYFNLKDADGQLRGVIWRGSAEKLAFTPEDGQEVLCRGKLDVYPPQGSYQLIVRHMQPLGEGAMQVALRQLKAKLESEGLFDPVNKKPLPGFPKRIGIVTSPSGAAVRDFLEVVRGRMGGIHVFVIPAKVQGAGAANEIANAIRLANSLSDPLDVLVVGRGGGSLEDLWCFNEEAVVRAIFESHVPVVSAVGHEIDVTLADHVADIRALTPTHAGELVVPSRDALMTEVDQLAFRMRNRIERMVQQGKQRLEALASRPVLRRPAEMFSVLARRVDELELRSERAIDTQLSKSNERLGLFAAQLQSLSPLAVLSRGYSVTSDSDNKVISSIRDVSADHLITTRISDGRIISRVESTQSDSDEPKS